MPYDFSENKLVQDAAGNLLEQQLGWEVVNAYNDEIIGEKNGTLGRKNYNEILLIRYIREDLFKYNDWMRDSYATSIIKILESYSATSSLIEINESKYKLIRDGIQITVKNEQGNEIQKTAKIIDFDNPENNRFIAVKELKIHGKLHRRRTDIVGFVNGIPLLFVELKNTNVDIQNAHTDNYTDYLDTIPHLFQYNSFIVFSNGDKAKVGTLGSKYEFFQEWKRLKEEDPGAVDLETLLKGICNKKTLLDLFENFIVFDHSGGRITKILARNHQYLGVNEAIESYQNRKFKEGKLGVFWHTQGSGKSYSMLFFTQKIRRKFEGSPTMVIITDRDELNKQISDTFEACGCLGNVKASHFIASSGEDLIAKLKGNPSYIFTLIQKFNRNDLPPIIPDHDIILISDEAHRTQNGIFSDNMCALLPTASRIGFTGTPLFTYDNITKRTFGDYVSIYDFQRAVDDGATVPLYYENRSALLNIENPKLNQDILDAIEQADLDPDQQEKMEREIAKSIHIITAEPRLRAIAKDFVNHYTELWTTGKAMFVCINKVTAVRMYQFVQEYWDTEIKSLEEKLNSCTQQEAQEIERKLKWMKETEMAVVISQEQNEIKHFNEWEIDIKPHREKMERRELDKDFKNPDHPFRVVFVCAMWLTGFDVKPLANLYIDKPLKAHTLMQTIARANRVSEGKSNGLIIDYIGVVKFLREALASYTQEVGIGPDPTPDKKELLDRIIQTILLIKKNLSKNGFILQELIDAKDFEKIAKLKEGANAISSSLESRKEFEIQARELFKLFKYVERRELTQEIRKEKDAIHAIYNQLQTRIKHADNNELMVTISKIVSEYLDVTPDSEVNKQFDISNIDFKRLSQEFKKIANKNLLIGDLKNEIEQRLERLLKSNPLRINYYEQYRKIVDDYNKEQDRASIEETFMKLMKLAQELTPEEKRYVREGFEDDATLTIYDILVSGKLLSSDEIKSIKKLAKELFTKIKEKINELDHWTEKENTQAEVSNLIRNELWAGLPGSYDDTAFDTVRTKLYEYIRIAYPAI